MKRPSSRRHYRLITGGVIVVLAGAYGLMRPALQSEGRAPVVPAPVHRVAGAAAETEPEIDSRLASARDALARQDLVAAFRACREARAQGAPLPDLLSIEAEVFQQAGYLDREIETLRQRAAAAPDDARPWLKLFHIFVDMGWRREAGKAAERAAQLAPHDPRSLVAQAIWHYRSSEPARALPFIEEAMRLNPAGGELANLHATILLKLQRAPEAETVLRGALARAPSDMTNRLALAEALARQGKSEEAAAQLREVERRAPGRIEAAYQLGVLAEKAGNMAEAARQFERVAAANARFSNVLWHLGRIYLREGRKEQGRELLKTYRKMDRDTQEFDTMMARLELQPENPQIHYQVARFRLDAGELPQAVVELRRVLELRPGDARARQDLITALKRQGRLTEAQRLAEGQPQP